MTSIETENGIDMEEMNTGGQSDHDEYLPMDGWIRLALYTDYKSVCTLTNVVETAIDKLQWEIRHVPIRWVHVRAARERDLAVWKALHTKLLSLQNSTDGIPF